MKASTVLVVAVGVSIIILLCLHFHAFNYFGSASISSVLRDQHDSFVKHLLHTIKIQNETLVALEKVLESHDPTSKKYLEEIHRKDSEIQLLRDRVTRQPASPMRVHYNLSNHATYPLRTKFDEDCEKRYGMDLIDNWKKNEEVWCSSHDSSSQLKCYPYHQHHKKLDGRGPDLFCVATNFIVDFSKVHGEHGATKPTLGQQYLSFDAGSLSSSCSKNNKFKSHLFMPHHSLQMGSFQSVKVLSTDSFETEQTTTYLLARDEDYENSFHSTADHMNMLLVMTALGISAKDQQIMLFDKHPDGPTLDLLQTAFSNGKIIRHSHYAGKKIMFSKLVFHLESPAGLVFPKVSRPDPLRCRATSFFMYYSSFVLKAFDLWDVEPPAIPAVTLSLRKRTPHKNVGRVLANEEELVAILNQGNLINVNVMDAAKLTYREQLKMIRSTNVLVGVHGAGLMFIMFAAQEAVLVEMHPSYRQDRHFRHAARMTGKTYMPLRSSRRETCQGTSDNVYISPSDFRNTIDGAIRIARSFDDGLSECGLVCPSDVLALDARLDPHYKAAKGEHKTAEINTRFPCG